MYMYMYLLITDTDLIHVITCTLGMGDYENMSQ